MRLRILYTELRGINPEFDENYLNEIEEAPEHNNKIEKKVRRGDYEAVTEFLRKCRK